MRPILTLLLLAVPAMRLLLPIPAAGLLLAVPAAGLLLAVPAAGLLLAVPAKADRAEFTPPATQVSIRLYGMGFMPLDGNFTRFAGWLTYDPAQRGACQVELRVDASSLTMSSATLRDEVAGPEFMDVGRYPNLSYAGACTDDGIEGQLTMHGITHPFALALRHEGTRLVAEGRLRRADWGMTARPLVGGSTVRIQVSLPRPEGAPL
jgi:polyisoprenoid-binding protein YceI